MNRHIAKDWRFNLALQFGLPLLALAAAGALGIAFRAGEGDLTLLWVALVMAVIGIVLLFVAKRPLYRRGRFATFGPSGLSYTDRVIYWTAYALIVVGVLMMFVLLAGLR